VGKARTFHLAEQSYRVYYKLHVPALEHGGPYTAGCAQLYIDLAATYLFCGSANNVLISENLLK
jgi:hypothetical protein